MSRTRLHSLKILAAPIALTLIPAPALAEFTQFSSTDTTLITPSIPDGFDRGRSVSVTDKARPDYDPLGIRFGGLLAFPKLEFGLGGTNNVFLHDTGKLSDGFGYVDPTLNVNSDWSRHQLQVTAGGDFQRYFHQTLRNQDSWFAGANGRVDIGDSFSITAEGGGSRKFESPYSGDTQSTVAVLSSYLTTYGSLRAVYMAGQTRFQLAYDRTGLSFNPIDLDGVEQSQRTRDRVANRGTGQFEFAFTPSVSAYVQGAYDSISYDVPLAPGVANRSSKGYRVIAGLNFDLASFLRGTIGAGYVRRNYDSALYRNVDGVSVEAKIEYFPSDLTTVTLNLRRILEDSSIGSSTAYFENSASLRVDHELLLNLLLNAMAQYGHVNYIGGITSNRDNYRFSAGAKYLASRRFGITANVGYGKQTAGDTGGQRFSEVRGQVGFYVQR